MKAAIFNPYLDTLGGGERYTFAFIEELVKKGYSVDVEWQNKEIKEKLEERFGRKISDQVSFIESINRGDGYDVCFWVSDGSIPTLKARKNFLHFQVPFTEVSGNSLLNKMKLFRINKIICNSEFTKTIIDKEYGVESLVIYPPVDTSKIKPKRKQNLILYVGRFSSLVQSKGQDRLIKEFKRFVEKGFKDWQLVLAGGIEIGADDFVKKLEKMSLGSRIKILKSPSFKELIELYGTAKFFWSASGFGVNEDKEPEKMEHFGITTVEAMAAGAVPIVFNGGGQGEIVSDGVNGYTWEKESEIVNRTVKLINKFSEYKKLSQQAVSSAANFSYEKFEKEISSII